MKKKVKYILIALVVLILIGIFAWGKIFPSNVSTTPEVSTAKAEKKNLTRTVSASGNIAPGAKEEIQLSATQKVTDIVAAEGQTVKKGALLLKVDLSDIQYQLKKAVLNLDMSRQSLVKLENSIGGNDKKSLENAVKQANLNLDLLTSSYNDAKQKLGQSLSLYNSGVISKEEYSASEKAVKDLENQIKGAEIQCENARNALASHDININDQIAAQKNQVEGAKADIENLKAKTSDGNIRAGIDGTIIKMNLKKNQYPSPTDNTITIYDLSIYKVEVEISQYDAISVKEGQKAMIKVKGLEKPYTGVVTHIDESAFVSANSTNKEAKLKIEVTLDNADSKLKAGYEADVDITIDESINAVYVNFEALLEDSNGKKYIFVVQNGCAIKRYVKTGIETDFDVQILDGLKEGEIYITAPPAELKSGDAVRPAGGLQQ